ncbi:MAG: TolC family protein [Planctomycetota bacterium]
MPESTTRRIVTSVLAATCGLSLLLAPACRTPEEYVEEADRDAYALVGAAREAAGQAPDPEFSVEAPDRLRDGLLLPRSDESIPGPRERLAREGGEVTIDLASALAIAARNSREFQDQRERLYLTALDLTGRVHDFENNYFGSVSAEAAANGDGESDSRVSVAENGSLGFTRLIETGGSFNLNIGQDLSRVITNPAQTAASAFLNLTLSLPLLRGAGREIAFESVTQAERDLLYAVRTYERFKRTFAVDVVSGYLGLLQSQQTVENERNNLERRQLTSEENKILGEAGRIARTDVERVNQSVLAAENRVVVAEQNFESALDRFKITLGLPTDTSLRIDPADLERLREIGAEAVDLDETLVTVKALRNRLDFATAEARVADAGRRVYIARDALRAGLDFQASFGANTNDFARSSFKLDPLGDTDFSLGLLLDLPLDRVNERNAYRSAIINYEGTRRDAEAFEDQVKLEARRGLRNLRQAAETYRIQLESLRVAVIYEDAAQLLKAAGSGSTNDLVDAQNELIQAQNAVLNALIDYRISRLELERDLGILVVGDDGIDENLTRELLMQED